MSMRWFVAALALGLITLGSFAPVASAEEMSVADGKIVLTPPEAWKKKMPSSRIVEFEYEIPAAEGDDRAGRLTVTNAGGSVAANVERWVGQFKQSKADQEKNKNEEKKVGSQVVHFVEISGTYMDSAGGPFSQTKPTARENYRMLAAIIPTKESGTVFIKFYGPKGTVAKNEEAFNKMITGLKAK